MGHGPHSSKLVVICFVLLLCCSVYCLCVNVYCTYYCHQLSTHLQLTKYIDTIYHIQIANKTHFTVYDVF
jgi:hypothetical protein